MGRRDDGLWGWVVFVLSAGALLYLALVILAHGRAKGDPAAGDAFTGKGVKDVSAKAAICAAALALSCGGGVDGNGLAPGRTPMLVPGVDSGSLVWLDAAGADAAHAIDVAADLALIDAALASADVAPAAPDAAKWDDFPVCRSIGFQPNRGDQCPFGYVGNVMGNGAPRCVVCSGAPRPCQVERDQTNAPLLCVSTCDVCPAAFRDGGAP